MAYLNYILRERQYLNCASENKANLKLTNWLTDHSHYQQIQAELLLKQANKTLPEEITILGFRDNPAIDSNPGNKMYFKRMNLNLPSKTVTSLTIDPPQRFSFFSYRAEFLSKPFNVTSKRTTLGVKSARI